MTRCRETCRVCGRVWDRSNPAKWLGPRLYGASAPPGFPLKTKVCVVWECTNFFEVCQSREIKWCDAKTCSEACEAVTLLEKLND